MDIATTEGIFTADEAGPADGPLVLLLHGFPQSRHAWRHQLPSLGAAGYHAVAPDGRGYSPGVRPRPTDGLDAYGIDRLVADVLDIADSLAGDSRFHLVGHDWGGQVAWVFAARHPDRLASLTVLSRPHPSAFQRAIRADADGQQHRSRHHRSFHDPATTGLLLDDDARRLRRLFEAAAVPADSVADYLSVLGDPEALEAALSWYRAAGALSDADVGPVTTPTLYVWGDADETVGRAAAETTAEWVTGPYRFAPLAGVGHFITDQTPQIVTEMLIQHLAAYPA